MLSLEKIYDHKKLNIFLTFILLTTLLACHLPPKKAPSGLMINGQRVGKLGWLSTVAIVKDKKLICTGVLVKPQIVLTAAHCITEKSRAIQPQLRDLSGYGIYFGSGQEWDEGMSPQFSIIGSGFHPDFKNIEDRIRLNLTPDLGYIVLDRPVADITPSQILSKNDEIAVKEGVIEATLVGFGPTKCDQDDEGKKRMVATSSLRFDKERRKLYIGDGQTNIACPGDSGSGAFIQLKNGEYRLMGILSQGFTDVAGAIDGFNVGTSIYEPLFDEISCWLQSKVSPEFGSFCPFPIAPLKPQRGPLDVQDMCPKRTNFAPKLTAPKSVSASCAIRILAIKRVPPCSVPQKAPIKVLNGGRG